MTDQPFIEARELTKSYGEHRAVDGLSFGINGGETFGFLGPNGAGKSSLLNTISGIVKPEAGSVVFEGKRITGAAPWV